MAVKFQEGKDKVGNLVEYYRKNAGQYRAQSYKEAHARKDFIDPFFAALGWDVHNEQQLPPQNQEVIIEDSVDIEGHKKAPDYAFRFGRTRMFFVEAKKPGVAIKTSVKAAYQLRRYAWSSKLALSLLTDFEELAVYDCRKRPVETDKASVARISYFRCEEYPDRWQEIWDVFSRDAVWSGSFDAYAKDARRQRGTSEVDDEFLREIEQWRDVLARHIANNNKHLDGYELNDAVQRTIDRIIFLRIAEDRGMEEYGGLRRIGHGKDIYARFMELCHAADEKYNSGLFDFSKTGDEITPGITISDRVLRPILSKLYYPDSPYEFSVLPADILGNVYEQFLGKVIRLLPSHRAVVEDKPEVKKAGGVYYTPSYIVDYIVKNTVGKKIEGTGPTDLIGFRVLDMACGSGSFLLGAYQYLMDHYLAWYETSKPQDRPEKVWQQRKHWRLTVGEKKRILTEHIFGVDIDRQAVEVTKLSLLLKVLEGENKETFGQQNLFGVQALPNLADNIKCGNSLIGWDYFDGKLGFDDDEVRRINPFDWEKEFPEAMDSGGFDCVIGNPPYRRERDYKDLHEDIAQSSLGKQFRSPRMDLWYYFVHRAAELLKAKGVLSYIVNAYWTAGTGSEKLISSIRLNESLEEIFFLSNLQIFKNVSGQHMIIRIAHCREHAATLIKLVDQRISDDASAFVTNKVTPIHYFKSHKQVFLNSKIDIMQSQDSLLSKLEAFPPLSSLGKIRQGIAENPSSINSKTNKLFGNIYTVGEGVFALSAQEVSNLKLTPNERKLLKPYFDLCDLSRYSIASQPSLSLIYSTKQTCPDIEQFSHLKMHLLKFKPIMDRRRETKRGSIGWWHLHWPRDESLWTTPKILSIQMAERPSFIPVSFPAYVSFSVNVFVPSQLLSEDMLYIAGILNSRLLWQWFKHNAKRRGVGLEINGNTLKRVPIRIINFSDPGDVAQHDCMVKLVERMLDLHKKLRAAKVAADKKLYQRQIDGTDKEIDHLVYELYGLTEEEIAIVEKE